MNSTIIIGATGNLAVEYLKLLSTSKNNVYLVFKNKKKLYLLLKKYNLKIKDRFLYEFNLLDISSYKKIINIIKANKIDNIILCQGIYTENDNINYINKNQIIFDINFKFTSIFLSLINKTISHKVNLIVFGSISSFFGRTNNIMYASSKRALDSFIESYILSKNNNIYIQYYKLGFLDTIKTKIKVSPLLTISAAHFCIYTLRRVFKKSFIRTAPVIWIFLKFIPFSIFSKFVKK